MDRIKSLNTYQKAILIIMIVMLVVFGVIYSLTINTVGFKYENEILEVSEVGGNILYSGNINGKKAVFTVENSDSVTFQYGDKIYGPYIVTDDESAIPQDVELSSNMTGMEISCDGEIIFRGGIYSSTAGSILYNEDGSFYSQDFVVIVNGIAKDSEGNIVSTIEPTVSTILNLVQGPSLTHKGDWQYFAWGVVICILMIVSILFADELFKWSMQFSIRNADKAEPSDWEIMCRYVGWTIVPCLTLVFLIIGLQ